MERIVRRRRLFHRINWKVLTWLSQRCAKWRFRNPFAHLGTQTESTVYRDLFYKTCSARSTFPLHRIVNMHKSNRKARIKYIIFWSMTPLVSGHIYWQCEWPEHVATYILGDLLRVVWPLGLQRCWSTSMGREIEVKWTQSSHYCRLYLQYCRLYLQCTVDRICRAVDCTVPGVMLTVSAVFCRLHLYNYRMYLQYCRLYLQYCRLYLHHCRE